MKEKKTMKKTIEIDKNKPGDVHVGDKLYFNMEPDHGYTIVGVDAMDGYLPYRVDLMEFADETTRHVIVDLGGSEDYREYWLSADVVSRITREIDVTVKAWPTPEHSTAYRGADGRLYVYMSDSDDDDIPWLYEGDDWTMAGRWKSAESMSLYHSDALPLTELVPKYDAAPEPRHITDIREVRIGFIVFAKGFSTPFVCAFRDNAQRDVSSAFYKDSLICVSGKLPDELSAICGGSLNYCWLRNDMFDYAIAPIDSLGLGGDHE